jgi:hypothetical protein
VIDHFSQGLESPGVNMLELELTKQAQSLHQGSTSGILAYDKQLLFHGKQLSFFPIFINSFEGDEDGISTPKNK